MSAPCSFFDTHIHLNVWNESARDGVLQAAEEVGVTSFLVPGVDCAAWADIVALSARQGVWAAPGVHPLAARQWGPEAQEDLRRLLSQPKVIAVGEIGLDGMIDTPRDLQERALRGQLRLAVSFGKPVLVHCRRATGRLLKILQEEHADRVGGIFHAFSGSLETALQAIDMGFALGFGGPLTYPNARKAPQVAREIPPEWIVLETDAPDLSPHPHRGEENRPMWLPLIAERLAQIRGWTVEQTCGRTSENARRILRLDD